MSSWQVQQRRHLATFRIPTSYEKTRFECPACWRVCKMNRSSPRHPHQDKVPLTVVKPLEWKPWVGGLIQGEGCIHSHYVKKTDSTNVDITIGMTILLQSLSLL